jgi:hypothetical protein
MLMFASLLVGVASAQDVPPPPKPDTIDPALAPILKSLKETLLSAGKVEYVMGGSQVRQQITNVNEDAPSCKMRVTFDSLNDTRPPAESYFFETIDSAEALTLRDADLAEKVRGGMTDYKSATPSSAGYDVVLNGNISRLDFGGAESAERAEALIRRAAEICRAIPPKFNPAAGSPTLAETLRFIEQKLNGDTAVTFTTNLPRPPTSNLPEMIPIPNFNQIKQAVADPQTCLVQGISVERLSPNGGPIQAFQDKFVLPLPRVEKIAVSNEQEEWDHEAKLKSLPPFKLIPNFYRLTLTLTDGDVRTLPFSDEDIANRVAKALNHAVELCGGGRKDPF